MAGGLNQAYTGAADILGYGRVSLAQPGAGRALLPLPHQPGLGAGLAQAPLGAGGNRSVYDSFQPGAAVGQQRLYY